jgi:nucleoid DNA-binding protein
MVNKATLIRKISKVNGIPLREAAGCIDTIIETMADAASRGESIELRGLGSFFVRKTASRKIAFTSNASSVIPEHGRVIFRPCQKLRESVWNKVNS